MSSLPVRICLENEQAWREMNDSRFLVLRSEAANPATFHATALVAHFGESLAAELSVGASRVVRRRVDAENPAAPYFKILWQLQGTSRIRQGPHSSTLVPGTWSVYDTTREYSIESSERARFMVLLVPQDETHGWSPAIAALSGRALEGGGAAGIVMAALAGLLRDGTPLDAGSQHTLQDSTVALLERALESQARRRNLSLNGDQASRLRQIQAYIGEHVGDTSMTPERVASVFGMSRRSLYNLFLTARATPRAFIQATRLKRACSLLEHASSRESTLAQIARSSGFADPAHFSRSFHLQFGMPPSAWRERCRRRSDD